MKLGGTGIDFQQIGMKGRGSEVFLVTSSWHNVFKKFLEDLCTNFFECHT